MDQPQFGRGEQPSEPPPQAVDVVITDEVAPQTVDGAITTEVPAPAVDRVISDVPAAAPRRLVAVPTAEAAEYPTPEHDRVRWGPVVAGSVVSLGALILLNAFGIAVGASALKPGINLANWWNWPGIYGGASLIVSLFLGGWVASRSAATASAYSGGIHGLLVGMATVSVIGLASLIGVGNLLGFLGANLDFISRFNPSTATTAAYNTVKHGAWGTLIFIAAGFIAAAIGGMLAGLRRTSQNNTSAMATPEYRPARA